MVVNKNTIAFFKISNIFPNIGDDPGGGAEEPAVADYVSLE